MIFQNFSIFWAFILGHALNMVRVFSILAKFRVKNFFSRIEFRLLIAPPFHPQNDFSYSCPCKKPIFSRNTSTYELYHNSDGICSVNSNEIHNDVLSILKLENKNVFLATNSQADETLVKQILFNSFYSFSKGF